MSPALAAGLQIALVVIVLALIHVPLGDYMARIFTASTDNKVESGLYRVLRIDAKAEQRWTTYLIAVVAFTVVSIAVLWGLLSLQGLLPFANETPNMPAAQGFNTAVSFVTNTNWQSYAGESALGYTVQAIGLTVQNFLSAAVGMAVVAALIRGLVRRHTDRLGNFWVDMTTDQPPAPAAVVIPGRTRVRGGRRHPEPQCTNGYRHDRWLDPDPARRPGGLPGGHQGTRHQRRRVFQCQFRAPLREPEAVTNLLADRADVGDPVLPATHLRPDGRQPETGLRHPGRNGGAVGCFGRGRHRDRERALRNRSAGGRSSHRR